MIPKYFYIFGEKIKISRLKEVCKGTAYGQWVESNNKIEIAKTVYKDPINDEQQEQAYFHELVHCLLQNIGEPDLCSDEVFVDKMGKALHQALKTSQY